ncbi:auxin-responsive protein SAUR71-like [Triticum urartu]|uniref:auxin-responsive protein SAUR71-like n=1 Tax=Triticum dicoccoides TaxID=85692 RepID=UPI0018905B81|nr:auxin-responsive protein SAUR71-like [Triticum dicoccoides]XP_044361747.1 auxin-responsive protein SAUR71-like [Triticum aestivum]XP_048573997.1 auxin-responsive protein SAUR71-like [Triticum urartu]
MARGKKNGGESSASPCHFDERHKVPRGHVPMVTGCGARVVVPVRLLGDPCIAEQLDMAAQQYGYGQPGVLRIPCDAGQFRRVVDGALHRADT